MRKTRYITVSAEVELLEISDDDLADELRGRGYVVSQARDVDLPPEEELTLHAYLVNAHKR